MKSAPIRRQSRELALQVLFQQEFAPGLDYHAGLETFRGNFAAPLEVWKYAEHLLAGIQDKREQIDQLISKSADNWSIARMALVDLNLMRIAVFEMAFSTELVPPPVAINEALEITKKYGTNDSAKFINAVLDQIKQRDP
ncbi:MAG: transcription antitermination factor NusB [Bdellovibrionales bacterium]|nr:transcription antitermination factor NusB [Bdellovibrionales bacterium]